MEQIVWLILRTLSNLVGSYSLSQPLLLLQAKWFLKVLVAGCHSFCLFFIFYNTHTYIHSITFIQHIYPSSFAGASLHFIIACKLSETNLPVVPSRESNSGLPYSKLTRYQLSHDAPCWATPHHQNDSCTHGPTQMVPVCYTDGTNTHGPSSNGPIIHMYGPYQHGPNTNCP